MFVPKIPLRSATLILSFETNQDIVNIKRSIKNSEFTYFDFLLLVYNCVDSCCCSFESFVKHFKGTFALFGNDTLTPRLVEQQRQQNIIIIKNPLFNNEYVMVKAIMHSIYWFFGSHNPMSTVFLSLLSLRSRLTFTLLFYHQQTIFLCTDKIKFFLWC